MASHFTFIASGGRTGTNFFGDQLSLCIDDCWSEHEPDMFAGFNALTAQRIARFGLGQVIGRRALGRSGLRITGTRFLKGDIDFDEVALRLRADRAQYHQSIPQSLIVESYSRWWMFADRLDEVFPGCRIAGIVRDPRSWIASWQKHNPGRPYFYPSHFLPPGPLVPETIGDAFNANRWHEIGEVGKLAWHWNLVNSRLLTASERTSSVRLFRFEDLFAADESVLHEFTSFAATFDDRRFNVQTIKPLLTPKKNASSAKPDDWTYWSDAEKSLVNEICGATMERCGYQPLPLSSALAA